MKLIKSLSAFLLILAILLNVACQKEEEPDAPNLPPEASFVMDYKDFSEVDTTNQKGYANWGYAGLNVLVWNVVLTVNLAVPVAAFYESFNHEPEYLGDLEWVWSYEVMVGNQKYQANLYGQIVDTDVDWKMYVSKAGQYTDFLWYEGTVNSSNQQANWTLYKSPTDPSNFLTINYLDDVANGKESIRYTKAEDIIATQASYIEYGNLADVDMDRYYTIYLQNEDKLTEIEWSYIDKNGRVRDEVHFQDTEWHCWDTLYLDTECP